MMAFASKPCIIIGLLSLTHAGYSAHEHSALQTIGRAATSAPSYSLPLDIRIETLLSVFLICFGLVAGADPLKPISWNVWAANIEHQGGRDNPFGSLEERTGFLDIRAKRKEFAEWVKERDTVVKS